MVGQTRPFSRVTLGIGAALTLGFTSLVAPAVADESNANAACEAKSWQEVADELLRGAEPELCEQAEESVPNAFSSGGGADIELSDIGDVTQAVGVNADGETVIRVSGNDEEIVRFLEEAYPDAKVKSGVGKFAAMAGINGDVVGGAGFYSSDGQDGGLCSVGFPAWTPDGEQAVITAGHCTMDGKLDQVALTDPQEDPAGGGNSPELTDYLGEFRHSQFGGANNQSGVDGTDVGVIDVLNDDLEFSPEVTDWSSPEELSASTSRITGVAKVDPNGAEIERSGRTTGYSSALAKEVDVVEGVAPIEGFNGEGDVRLVYGFNVEGLGADEGDSGGPVYQGGNAIGLVSGGDSVSGDVWATDLQDALTYVDGYTVQLFVAAPEITSIEDGGTVAAGSAIRGTAPAGSTLVVTPDQGDAFEVDVDSSGEWSFPAPEDNLGLYEFELQAKKGYDESETVPYSVEVTIPAPAFTSHEDGDVVNEPITQVTGTGLEDATVTLEVNGEEVGTADVVDGNWSIDADLGYGEHELVATQELDGEESAEVTASVTVAPAAPVITSPEDGDAFDEGETPAMVEGTGLNGATVALEVNGEEVGTADVVDGEWSIDLPAGLAAGDHELTAVQTIEDVSSGKATVTITVNEDVVDVPGDDTDEDETDEGTGGGGNDSTLPTLPETGINDGVAPALIAAALLVAAGIATRIWKRAAA